MKCLHISWGFFVLPYLKSHCHFFLRALILCILPLIGTGCGSSDGGFVNSSSFTSQGTTQTAIVRLESVLAQTTVPSEVDQVRGRGFDAEQQLLYGPEVREKAAQIDFADVPVTVTDMVIEYLAAGRVVGLAQVPVSLSPDQIFTIDNPEILGVSGTLQSMSLSPGSLSLAAGTSGSLTLTALFNDGSSQDFTSAASWSVENEAVASVDQGVVTGTTSGSTTARASFGGLSATAQVEVTDASLLALELSPLSPAVAQGTEQPFEVLGLFSDASEQDLTDQVEWTSSEEGVATIDGAGLAQAQSAGQSTITATLGEVEASTVLTVTSAQLTGLTIEGPENPVPAGTVAQLKAVGRFSDSSEQDLTSLADWASNSPSFAEISGPGTVHTLQAPNANIQASFGGFTPTFDLSISDAEVVSIEVRTIASAPSTVTVGSDLQLQAIATLTDDTTDDITDSVAWTSEQSGTASVVIDTGLVSGVSEGQAEILATFSGAEGPIVGQLVVTVLTAPTPSLTIPTGAHTFNTDTGELTLQGQDPVIPEGWNDTTERLELEDLTLEDGATLTVTGDNPFRVRALGDITVDGTIDRKGADNVTPGPGGGNGEPGGDVNLFCAGALTVGSTGSIDCSGGNGGDENVGDSSGYGGVGGTVTLTSGDSLDVTGSIDCSGGDAGDNSVGDSSGNGGVGGTVTLTSGDSLDVTGSIDCSGGDGGDNNVSDSGGNGGDGGDIIFDASGALTRTGLSVVGGTGGTGNGTHGGNAGNNGTVSPPL